MLAWIAETTLVASALALVATLVGRSERLGPSTRHALWLVVLLKLVTPPLVAWPRPAWLLPATAVVTATATDSPRSMAAAVEEPPSLPPAGFEAAPDPEGTDVVFVTEAEAALLEAEPLTTTAGLEPELPPEPAEVTELVAVEDTPIPLWPGSPGPRVEVAAGPWAAWSAWGPDAARLRAGALGLWGLGALGWVLVQGRKIRRFGARVRRSEPAPGWIHAELEALAPRLGVTPPPVAALPGLDSPLLWCAGRARLLVPALAAGADRPGWRGVLAHELAHLRRGDPWVSRLTLVAGALWWWNPLYWLVRSRLEAEAELACDAWAVWADPQGRRSYAEALLEVGAGLARSTAPAPALGLGGGDATHFFERRLTMIVRNPLAPEPPRGRLLAAGLLGLVALPAWSAGQDDLKPARPVDGDQPARTSPDADSPEAAEVKAALAEVRRELPAALDELKRELPAAMAELKRELPAAMAELKRELPAALAEVKRELPAALAELKRELPAALAEVRRELPIAGQFLASLDLDEASVSAAIEQAVDEVAVTVEAAAAEGLAEVERAEAAAGEVDRAVAEGLAEVERAEAAVNVTVNAQDTPTEAAKTTVTVVGEAIKASDEGPEDGKPLDDELKAKLDESQARIRELQGQLKKRQDEMVEANKRLSIEMRERMAKFQAEMAEAQKRMAEQMRDASKEMERASRERAELLKDLRAKGYKVPAAEANKLHTYTIKGEPSVFAGQPAQRSESRTVTIRKADDGTITTEENGPEGKSITIKRVGPEGADVLKPTRSPLRVEGRALNQLRQVEGRPMRELLEERGRYRSVEGRPGAPVPPIPPVPPVPPIPPAPPRADRELNQRVDRLEQKFDTLLDELRSMRKELKAGDKD